MRLSDPLKHDAIAAGYIQPWARDNAKRKPDRKGYRLRSSGPLARAPRESGQLLLFPEFSKPVARLQAFRGARMPPAVAAEAEFRRRQLDLSQRELLPPGLACHKGSMPTPSGGTIRSQPERPTASGMCCSRAGARTAPKTLWTRTSRLHSGNQSVSDEAPTAFRNFGAFKTQQQADPSLEIPVDAACM